MFKGKKRLWSGGKKSGSPTGKNPSTHLSTSTHQKTVIPQLILNELDDSDDGSSSDRMISPTKRQEFVITPHRTQSGDESDLSKNANKMVLPEISELSVEVIPVPGPFSSLQNHDSLPDVSWTTTTNTSSYTISSKKDVGFPYVSRLLEENDVDLLRDFIIKVDGAQEAKKFTDKSFIYTLLTDNKRGVVNMIFVDAWYVMALVSIVIDKRPWQKHNQARVIEFKILPTHRNLKVIQLIVQSICATASTKRCARIIVHASPDDFKLFASADWVVERKKLSRIHSSIPEINVERSWSADGSSSIPG